MGDPDDRGGAGIARRDWLSRGLLMGGAALAGLDAARAGARPLHGPGPSAPRFDVRTEGAAGDGRTDDTAAVQRAINRAVGAGQGVVYFPAGSYRITRTLTFDRSARLDIVGDGMSTKLLWSSDTHLFRWDAPCREVNYRDLAITPHVHLTPSHAAVLMTSSTERTTFDNVHILPMPPPFSAGSGVAMPGLCDTVSFVNCVFWNLGGTGVTIGRGSSIYVIGGRMIGDSTFSGGIGIHCTGNNGGVYITTTDIIGHSTGVLLDSSSGQGSNREIFLTHATIDSCSRGLHIQDSSYTSIAGCWAASCAAENIRLGAGSPLLVISGGTIFNGGMSPGVPAVVGGGHGLVAESGSFMLTGVDVRNNAGTGVWVQGDAVRDYSISGCMFIENGRGLSLSGQSFVCANNVLARNKAPSGFGGPGGVVNNNVGQTSG